MLLLEKNGKVLKRYFKNLVWLFVILIEIMKMRSEINEKNF